MKNVFYIIFIFPILMFSQNLVNSNWIFGYSNGLEFNLVSADPNAYLVDTSPPYSSFEGCASVSSKNGNLLLFSNGISLWRHLNGEFHLITNSLNGHISSTQNVIIVARPNHPNNYYIVTIDGTTGDEKGLFYSEIDLSVGNGQMISLNIPLKDQLGNFINEGYGNISEGLTSTNHANNSDFWITAHVLNQNNSGLLTYIVTEDGIVDIPANFIQTANINYTSNNFIHSIKISQDKTHLAFSTNNLGVYLCNFDSTNGTIIYNQNAIGTSAIGSEKSCYGLEFSSDRLFYTCRYMTSQQNLFENAIRFIPITNPNNENTLTTSIGGNGSNIFACLQRHPYKVSIIYVAILGFNFLSQINAFTISNAPTFDLGTTSLFDNCRLGLPQIVQVNEDSFQCFRNVSLTSPDFDVYNGQDSNVQASNFIQASNFLESNSVVIYHAENSIALTNGFYSANGSKFRGYIEGCTGVFSGKTSINNTTSADDELIGKMKNSTNKVIVFPNPTNSIVTIESKDYSINKVIINSIDGKQVFTKQIDNSNSYEIDASNFSNGIYILNIETKDGMFFTEKLIKN